MVLILKRFIVDKIIYQVRSITLLSFSNVSKRNITGLMLKKETFSNVNIFEWTSLQSETSGA